MNCQDLCRILESRDVNALAAAERRGCEAHAASCPHCGPEWIVYTRLAAIATPPMPQQLAMRCEAVAQQRRSGARPSSRTVLVGTILVVAAAAAMLAAYLVSAPPKAVGSQSAAAATHGDAIVATATPAAASPAPGAAPQPVTVQVVLDQMAGDPIGRDYGQRIYAHAREELGALPGMVLVDGDTAAGAAPAFRITYTNLAVSPAGAPEPYIAVELLFKVEALRRSAGADIYQKVFWSTPPPPGIAGLGIVDIPPSIRAEYAAPSFDHKTVTLASSARISFRPDGGPSVPVDCVERRGERCRYTPADIAAFTILSWRLEMAAPDTMLAARLHAMLRDSSTPAGLWLMALVNLQKYGMLRLDLSEILAAMDKVGGDDPALGDELMREALKIGGSADLMREIRDLLLNELPDKRRRAGRDLRARLVTLLATDLKNEPDARSILESVAEADPEFDVRAAAKRVLGMEQEPALKPSPVPSFMGPIEEQL